MRKVRMLLRVSSNQQLEADGDLTVQRQIVLEYIEAHEDWELDSKEYFEGSKSGYSKSVASRDILQEALKDAQAKEYDILVVYKDDRVGRRMWEIGAYVMTLKHYGVDIYTVKDGCISPEADDMTGQMMLALRYGSAQKQSADTGMRVRDTAIKLVERGRFIGGKAPYGYDLVLSGEISKHGRALHELKINPQEAEVVKYIYSLSLNKELGSQKIAKILNEDEYYKLMAPNDYWKSGTITSILTNPIYTGYRTYNRRQKINHSYVRLDSKDWVRSKEINPDIVIIAKDTWNRTQEKRSLRSKKYTKALKEKNINVIQKNVGALTLIDVAYCGYCGGKLTNGTKYNYWTIKGTGEKRASKKPMYKCMNAQAGIPHNKVYSFDAQQVEEIVYKAIGEYLDRLQNNENIFLKIQESASSKAKNDQKEVESLRLELSKLQNDIAILEKHIPDAMTNTYALTLTELMDLIHKRKEEAEEIKSKIQEKDEIVKQTKIGRQEWDELRNKLPNFHTVFEQADRETQRVIVNKLINRIDITKDQIDITFKINLDDFLPRIYDDNGTILCRPGSG